jgi:acyl carrier protein
VVARDRHNAIDGDAEMLGDQLEDQLMAASRALVLGITRKDHPIERPVLSRQTLSQAPEQETKRLLAGAGWNARNLDLAIVSFQPNAGSGQVGVGDVEEGCAFGHTLVLANPEVAEHSQPRAALWAYQLDGVQPLGADICRLACRLFRHYVHSGSKRNVMATATLAPPVSAPVVAPFPSAAVEADLRSELIEIVKSEAAIRGVALPPTPVAIGSTPFQIDSLVVVSILCIVEPLLGIELPENVVRTGGYRSVDQALAQLLPNIETFWKKRKGGK